MWISIFKLLILIFYFVNISLWLTTILRLYLILNTSDRCETVINRGYAERPPCVCYGAVFFCLRGVWVPLGLRMTAFLSVVMVLYRLFRATIVALSSPATPVGLSLVLRLAEKKCKAPRNYGRGKPFSSRFKIQHRKTREGRRRYYLPIRFWGLA